MLACGQVLGIGVTQKNAPSFGSSAGAGLKPPTLYSPRMNSGVSMTCKLALGGSVTKSLALTKAVAVASDCRADAMKVAAVACRRATSASACSTLAGADNRAI